MTDRLTIPREPTLDECEGALREWGLSKKDARAERELLRHTLGTPHEHRIARVLRTAYAIRAGLLAVEEIKPVRRPRAPNSPVTTSPPNARMGERP